MVALTRAGELVVSTDRDRLTGVVRVQRLHGETGESGMLAPLLCTAADFRIYRKAL